MLLIIMSTLKWKQENKDKQAVYYKKWYQSHKAEQYARVVAQRKKLRERIDNHKSKFTCKCGQNHIAALTFHHRDPSQKDGSIANATRAGWSIERLQKEISKCTIMCFNCHAILHWEEKQTQS